VIEKSGSWFSYKGDRIGQGRENSKQFLKDNTDLRDAIDIEVRKALGLTRADSSNGQPAEPIAIPAKAAPAIAPRR
jgi:recombination protein RecA